MTTEQSKATTGSDEERFRNLVETTSDWVWEVDEQCIYTYVSPRVRDLLGYEPEEVLGKSPFDFMPPLEAQRVSDLFSTLKAQPKPISSLENTNLHKDGHLVVLETSGVPVFDPSGTFRGYRGIDRDITERKHAAESLAERVRMAALAADVGAALIEGESLQLMLDQCAAAMVKHLDAAFARIWWYNQEEDVLELQASAGMYTDIHGTHSRIPVGQLKIGLIAKERKAHLTNTVIGDPFVDNQEWAKREGMVAFAGYPLIVEDRLVGVMGLFAKNPLEDVTISALASVANEIAVGIERKRAESALRESEERYRSMFETAMDPILVLDQRGRFIDANRPISNLTGYSYQEIIDMSLGGLTPPESREKVLGFFEQVKHLERLAGESQLQCKDGRAVDVEFSATKMGTDRYQVTFRDITERKKAEHLREEYVSLISHDLRAPLTVIQGQAEWLRRLLVSKGLERESHSADSLLKNAKRMNAMIQDLVESARLESGRLEMRKEPTDLLELVSEIAERVSTPEARARIMVESPEWVPPVLIDRDRTERAVTNLVTNALKYSPADTPVVVRLGKGDNGAIVSVTDQGGGVAPEDLPHLFERFYRASTANQEEGLGLGLYITRLIVEAHGGRVWVESDPGKGSTFYFSLPLV